MLPEERGGGEDLVTLEAGHTPLHVGVAEVLLKGATYLEACTADGALPWHKVLVCVNVHKVVCLTCHDSPTPPTLVLPVHLVLLQQLLYLGYTNYSVSLSLTVSIAKD